MKKHLLILSLATLAFSATTVKAQLISTADDDFEQWSPDILVTTAMDPNNGMQNSPGWQCFNVLNSIFTGSSPLSVFQDSTIVHSGRYACMIKSVALTSTSYNFVKKFVPTDTCAIVVSGEVSTGAPYFNLGVPFSNQITQLVFWYQYAPQVAKTTGMPDTAFCSITLSKAHVPIAAGKVTLTAASKWTLVTVPITYGISEAPDTAIVIFSASSFTHPGLGSVLYVDGESVVAGMNTISSSPVMVNVYPNPASQEINFGISGSGETLANTVEVYDITGQKINTYEVKNNFLTINTSGVATGLYIYKVIDKSGSLLKTGKFSVAR